MTEVLKQMFLLVGITVGAMFAAVLLVFIIDYFRGWAWVRKQRRYHK